MRLPPKILKTDIADAFRLGLHPLEEGVDRVHRLATPVARQVGRVDHARLAVRDRGSCRVGRGAGLALKVPRESPCRAANSSRVRHGVTRPTGLDC